MSDTRLSVYLSVRVSPSGSKVQDLTRDTTPPPTSGRHSVLTLNPQVPRTWTPSLPDRCVDTSVVALDREGLSALRYQATRPLFPDPVPLMGPPPSY